MKTHDLGRAYWTVTNIIAAWSSPLQIGWTAETDEPYRQGKCVVLHVVGTRYGIALGWWGREDEQATLRRMGVRDLDLADLHEMEEADC